MSYLWLSMDIKLEEILNMSYYRIQYTSVLFTPCHSEELLQDIMFSSFFEVLSIETYSLQDHIINAIYINKLVGT